jgi:hypothetical protein
VGAELARDGGRSGTTSPKAKKYFQLSSEVNPDAIRVVTETASHSHPVGSTQVMSNEVQGKIGFGQTMVGYVCLELFGVGIAAVEYGGGG